jgi:hypothetical protein
VEWLALRGMVAARNGRSCSFDCRRAIEGKFLMKAWHEPRRRIDQRGEHREEGDR